MITEQLLEGMCEAEGAECFVCVDDIFLPSDEASRNESDDFDHEIEEFKRLVPGVHFLTFRFV